MRRQRATLRTARLDVRPLTMDDLDAFHALWSDPRVIFWGALGDRDASRRMLTSVLARTIPGLGPSGWFAVVRRDDGAFVGDVVLQPAPWAPDQPEIGWHTATAHQGRGYATEAARELLAHARAAGVRDVEAAILPDNLPSQTVAVRIGMRMCGEVERSGLLHDLWRIDFSATGATMGPPGER